MFQFYPWFNFYFPLFLCMVMYDNEYKTKETKIEPRIKLNHNRDFYENTYVNFDHSPTREFCEKQEKYFKAKFIIFAVQSLILYQYPFDLQNLWKLY